MVQSGGRRARRLEWLLVREFVSLLVLRMAWTLGLARHGLLGLGKVMPLDGEQVCRLRTGRAFRLELDTGRAHGLGMVCRPGRALRVARVRVRRGLLALGMGRTRVEHVG